jgi:hypothetical protein
MCTRDANGTGVPRDGTGRDGTGRGFQSRGTGRDGTGRDGFCTSCTGRNETRKYLLIIAFLYYYCF